MNLPYRESSQGDRPRACWRVPKLPTTGELRKIHRAIRPVRGNISASSRLILLICQGVQQSYARVRVIE